MKEDWPPPFTDFLLERLVDTLNLVEDSTDGRVTEKITLFVKGLIVSGTIISRKEFLRSHLVLSQLDEIFDKLESEGAIPKRVSGDPFYFIHLKDAQVFSAGHPPMPATTGMYWRGRIDSVDGFSIVSLEQQK